MTKNVSNNSDMPLRVIYVGGVPHNGSTIFSLALGNHPKAVFPGEVSLLPRLGWFGDSPCSCGAAIRDCPFWSSVREKWTAGSHKNVSHLVDLEFAVDRNRQLVRQLIVQAQDSKLMLDYAASTYLMFRAISATSNKSVIVDSSKRTSRALALANVPGLELRLIHLVRDARGVSYSWARPERATRRRTWLSSAMEWLATNAFFELVKRRLPSDKSLLVRYEDFTKNPRDILSQVGNTVDMDLDYVSDLLTNGEQLQSEHVGIGNRFLKDKKPVVLRPDESWRDKMPKAIQDRVWMLTSPMMRRYGYHK